MQITPFKAEDFLAIDPQPAQEWVRGQIKLEQLRAIEGTTAWTGSVDGKPVWCFGWSEVYPTRALVWTYIGADAGPHLVAMHREAVRLLDAMPHKRIETEVDCDFEQGHRWVRMLGFELDAARLRGHRADGGDVALYARVKP